MTAPAAPDVGEIARIRAWRDSLAREAELRGEKMFMGKPDAWYDDLHWFCPNGHVSGRILIGDREDRCLACLEPVLMGPPMTESQFAAVRQHLTERSGK